MSAILGAPYTSSLGDDIFLARIPNFFSMEARPFDPATFVPDDGEVFDELGRRRVKLGVENAVRWRNKADVPEGEEPVAESNTRLVKWSDGSMSLVIGDEYIDCNQKQLANLSHLFTSNKATGQEHPEARHVFKKRVTFRPAKLASKMQQRITMSIAESEQHRRKVRVMNNVTVDPEEAKRKAIERHIEARRAKTKLENQQRRKRERNQRDLSADYLEGDDVYGAPSIADMKHAARYGGGLD
eukprot:UC1_evm1s327